MPPDTLSYNWGLLTVSANTEDGGIACTQRLSILVVESWEPILYERNWNGINWSKWARIATATPPQEFDLPLADGWTGLAKYYKTQENICFIELDILKNATIQNGEVLATLPEGFRPSYLRMHPAIVYSPHSSTTISVSPTGSVLFGDMSGSPSARNIYATLVFVAAS